LTLDEYCNSSASDRFHGNPHDDEDNEDTDIDFYYELGVDLKEEKEKSE